MQIPDDPDALLTRKQAADALTARGYPTSDKTLCYKGDPWARADIRTFRAPCAVSLGRSAHLGQLTSWSATREHFAGRSAARGTVAARATAQPMNPLHEWDPVERCPVGKNPRNLRREELEAAGHHPRPPLKAIRANCLKCANDSPGEVRRCTVTSCDLWPYRKGTNPFRRKADQAARTAAGDRLHRAKQARKSETEMK